VSEPAPPNARVRREDALLIAYYGDDFTGATDTLGTAARAGMRSLLFMGLPTDAQLRRAGPLDCLGVAGAARSMAPAAMRAALAPVAARFASLRPRVVHYKTCSTFDSAVFVGNVAVAVEVFRGAGVGVSAPTMIVGGQPSLARYCLFSELFAAAGEAVYRIDRHPTMSRHPVTPMLEADLRLHFATLGLHGVSSIPYPVYTGGMAAVRERVQALAARGSTAILFDVAAQGDLSLIGESLAADAHHDAPLLAVGPSSVVEALATQWGRAGAPQRDGVAPASGPVLLLAGSLSPVTARQVAAASSYRMLRLDAARLASGDASYCGQTAARVAAHLAAGEHVLVSTSDGSASAGVAADTLARAGGELLARVLAACPVKRFGIAGGDTSSLAMSALDAWGLSYVSRIAPGVALCRLHSDSPSLDGMEVMLKGGQMGPDDLFEAFVHGAAAPAH